LFYRSPALEQNKFQNRIFYKKCYCTLPFNKRFNHIEFFRKEFMRKIFYSVKRSEFRNENLLLVIFYNHYYKN